MERNGMVYGFSVEQLRVVVAPDRNHLGKLAAENVSRRIRETLEVQPNVRMVFAAAPSQDEFLSALCADGTIDWNRISAFHMDEYIGLSEGSPQLFGKYLEDHIFSKVSFKSVQEINSQTEDIEAECERYSRLLTEKPIDIVCMGIGENGHIAFNDPPVADFRDGKVVKVVELDKLCRMQQVNDGCFASIEDVPVRAITLTVPTLMAAGHLAIVVPGIRKAEAVRRSLSEKIDESCPATILRTHPDAILFLDRDSASKIRKP